MRKKSPQEVYEELSREGAYSEARPDKQEIEKVLSMVKEDLSYVRRCMKDSSPSWRVVFNDHYDILRSLCETLILFKNRKTSSHLGVFSFVVLHFPELEFEWFFLDQVRDLRNKLKYERIDISEMTWKSVEMQVNLYISALQKEIEKRLGDLS